jgi:hypothetical protein
MERREALQKVALLLGGTVLGASAFLSGCKNADSDLGEGVEFTQNDMAFLDEVAETIIPTTSTPGAKAAKVGAFMALMVKDCYEPKDQKVFREGMGKIDKASKKKFDKAFMAITPEQRTQLLTEIHQEMRDETAKADLQRKQEVNRQKEEEEKEEQKQNSTQESEKTSLEKQQDKSKDAPAKHYFRMMKELTLLGYFTSEIGQTQALRFNMAPGRYDGCVPYKKGDKAWA